MPDGTLTPAQYEILDLVWQAGDDGTNDMLVSDVIRANELQVWFLSQHVVDLPLARATNGR